MVSVPILIGEGLEDVEDGLGAVSAVALGGGRFHELGGQGRARQGEIEFVGGCGREISDCP